MRNFIITFTAVIWFIYVLFAFIKGDFNFFNWSTETRFLCGVVACFFGGSIALSFAINDSRNE